MLLVQKFLKNQPFGKLKELHGVDYSFNKAKTKFSLNYSQINSKNFDILAQQCRGLILSRSDYTPLIDCDSTIPGDTNVIAAPLFRFFNFGQKEAVKINLNNINTKILSKLDGTLCLLYYCPITNQFHVGTRSVPEADIPLSFAKYTFRTLFEKAVLDTLNISFDEFIKYLDKNNTYCFELTSPFNKVVVNYSECKIHLLAIRNNLTLLEQDPDKSNIMQQFPDLHVQSYCFSDIKSILKWVSEQDPLEHEGVVIRDDKFNRIKLKNARYIAFNNVKDRVCKSYKNCLELILLEKDDDIVFSILPQEIFNTILDIKDKTKFFIKKYDNEFKNILNDYYVLRENNSDWDIKKCFAMSVKQRKDFWHAPFFEMFSNNVKDMLYFIQSKKHNGIYPDSLLNKILVEIGYK